MPTTGDKLSNSELNGLSGVSGGIARCADETLYQILAFTAALQAQVSPWSAF